jgi:phage tail protein X
MQPTALDSDSPHNLLDHITLALLGRLAPVDRATLEAYMRGLASSGSSLSIGTGCSGPDVFITAMAALDIALTGSRSGVFHVFSAEKDADIRSFLKMGPPFLQKIFTSVECLQCDTALTDVGTDRVAQPVPMSADANLF